MRMTTALQHQDSVLLAPVQETVRGWSIRPGTFRVARPYDTTAIATADTAIQSMSSSAQSESQQPPHDSEDSRLRKRQRISKRAANCFQDPENDTVQWIESEFFPLINETVAQTLVRDMRKDHFYGTFVHAPASHAFALDFVQLRPTLRLLRSGFQSTFDNVRENEPRRSSRKDGAYQQDAIVFPEIHLSTGLQQLDLGDIYESAVVNDNSDPAIISFPSDGCPHYVIPPHSGFTVSDFDRIQGLTGIARERGGFDIIVMDPPWQNASVDRMAHYDTLDLYDLFKIPIPELLRVKRDKKTEEESHQEGVVAVWITNRAKVKRIVVEKLFPAWGLELVAQWYWLKITTAGEPVLSLHNQHRRPYEGIMIGRPIQRKAEAVSSSLSAVESSMSRRLLVSVPAQHSRKPSLGALLEQHFFSQRRHPSTGNTASPAKADEERSKLTHLELFARNLEEGVFSWGNEPIRHQYCGHGANGTRIVQDGFLVPT